jgi:hypothetical protein
MTTTTNVTTAPKPITTNTTTTSNSATHTDLTSALLQAISGLSQLISQLAAQITTTEPVEAKTAAAAAAAVPWQEELTAASQPESVAVCPSPNLSSLWDELSVVELRSLLRSYPIDRSSLPAPIELMRRNELIEALNQIQALGV